MQGRGRSQPRIYVEGVPVAGDGAPGDALAGVQSRSHSRPELVKYLGAASQQLKLLSELGHTWEGSASLHGRPGGCMAAQACRAALIAIHHGTCSSCLQASAACNKGCANQASDAMWHAHGRFLLLPFTEDPTVLQLQAAPGSQGAPIVRWGGERALAWAAAEPCTAPAGCDSHEALVR